MKYTVDRQTWHRGEKYSRLLTPVGKRCCLGFVGKQRGYSDNELYGLAAPSSLDDYSKWPKWFFEQEEVFGVTEYNMTDDVNICISINDTLNTTDEFKEVQLKEIFALHGDEIEFIN